MQSLGASADSTAAQQFNAAPQNGANTNLMQQTDSSIATPNLGSSVNDQPDGTAPDADQASQDVNHLGQPSVDSDVTATGGADRVTAAYVSDASDAADGATINAGGSINISTTNLYHLQQITGSASVGLVGYGAGISVFAVNNNASAYVGSYGTLRAGGAITVTAADQDSQQTPTQIKGLGGAAGLIAVEANIATLNLTSNTTALVKDHAGIQGAGRRDGTRHSRVQPGS